MERKITIEIDNLELEVEYWFQPEEKPERGPEAQYPGCHAEIEEITDVKFEGESIMKYPLDLDSIEATIWEKLREEEISFNELKAGI